MESPDADRYNGQNIEAQELCHELGLLPGWSLEPVDGEGLEPPTPSV